MTTTTTDRELAQIARDAVEVAALDVTVKDDGWSFGSVWVKRLRWAAEKAVRSIIVDDSVYDSGAYHRSEQIAGNAISTLRRRGVLVPAGNRQYVHRDTEARSQALHAEVLTSKLSSNVASIESGIAKLQAALASARTDPKAAHSLALEVARASRFARGEF